MTNEEFLKRLGIELKVERVRQELSQQELAKLCGLDAQTCGDIERGKADSKILSYKRMADALGVELKDFM